MQLNQKELSKLEDKLKAKVVREYEAGYNHIQPERDRKRNILEKVLNVNIPKGQIRVNLLWKNLQLENALFVQDELNIKLLSDEGVLGEEMMKNANMVLQYDDVDMNLKDIRETIINHNGLYGLSATIIDTWDNEEKQPVADVLNPLAIIVDPNNYNSSKMRFFGVERRVSRDYLENSNFEGVKDKFFATSSELERNKQSDDNANNLGYVILEDDGYIDIYDHFTTCEGKKYLTTWANERTILLRAVELEPLSEAEKKKPSKIKWPIQLHRRKPKFGSVFGVSIADEILNFQDAISKLTNLQLIQANNQALGPDIFVDSKLGIDTELLSEGLPGGRVIPIENQSGLPTQNGIYAHQLPNPSPFIQNMVQTLEARAEGTTNVNQQSFGMSQAGTQTKAEIQTLQQNANQILMWISNNYLDGQKEYRTEHYRQYVLNFKGKKNIALYQKGNSLSKSFKREDFVSEGKVLVFIESKNQNEIANDKEFNKLTLISNFYLQNMKPGYAMNEFLRTLGRKSNIRNFDEYKYIPETPDEMDAKMNLILLNNNEDVLGPEPGQDYLTYINIYKQALDTPAKARALFAYENAYMTIQKPMEGMQEQGQGDQSISGIAMNNLNQQSNTSPSTQLVTNT